jgi:hypothetical protein
VTGQLPRRSLLQRARASRVFRGRNSAELEDAGLPVPVSDEYDESLVDWLDIIGKSHKPYREDANIRS